MLDISSDRIFLTWTEPEKKNGAIEGYRVYYVQGNLTDVQSIQETGPIIHYNLTKLSMYLNILFYEFKLITYFQLEMIAEPNTEYEIFVKAYTSKHEGNKSEEVYNKTDIPGPGQPKILNLTCEPSDTIYIKWARPLSYFHSVDFYNVFVHGGAFFENIMLPTSTEHLETSVIKVNSVKLRSVSNCCNCFNCDFSTRLKMSLHILCMRFEFGRPPEAR